MRYNILLVEDQKEISDIVAKYLVNEGYSYFIAKDGFEALNYFNSNDIHLVLLDIMMPGIDGFEVLKEIRKTSEVPVIMLTAKQGENDRLEGFDTGADDYVIKPFSSRELMKRIKVLLKRVYNELDEMVYIHNNLSLYSGSRRLSKNGEEIEITSAEFKLLLVMFRNKGKVLTREQLIKLAFGQEYEGYDRNVDSYIKRIRQKIEDNPRSPKLLTSKYGAGYLFGDDNL